MTMNDSRPPKPRHRWYQFSLRTLLVFVAVGGIGLGWLGVRLQRARKQKEAVEAILMLGGSVSYDCEFDEDGNLVDRVDSTVPAWLLRMLGPDFFYEVTHVFCWSEFGGDDATHFQGLGSLELLWLENSDITDAGLKNLRGLTKLRELNLRCTRVTDEGLEHLAGLTNLEALYLDATQVTDAGLRHLESMKKLRSLGLSETQVTDAGLRDLQGLTTLELLYLDGTQVTDAGLEYLSGSANLRELILKSYHVSGTQVTDEGVEKLRQSLPNCVIHR